MATKRCVMKLIAVRVRSCWFLGGDSRAGHPVVNYEKESPGWETQYRNWQLPRRVALLAAASKRGLSAESQLYCEADDRSHPGRSGSKKIAAGT